MALGVSPERVREVRFAEQWRGYRTDEVDEFVEQVAEAFDQLEARVRESSARAEEAERRLLDRGPDEDLSRTLVLAQRTADLAQREAEAEAARLVHDAELRVRQVVDEAEARCQRLDQETESRIASELGDLVHRRQALEHDVASLSSFVEQERRRLADELRQQLAWLEQPGRLEPAPPPRRASPPGLDSIPAPGGASVLAPGVGPGVDQPTMLESPLAEDVLPEHVQAVEALLEGAALEDVQPEEVLSEDVLSEDARPEDGDAVLGASRRDDDTVLVDLDLPWLRADQDADEADPDEADLDLDGASDGGDEALAGGGRPDGDWASAPAVVSEHVDPFIAELQRAADDPEPLGPRDDAAPSEWSNDADVYDVGRRFRRRRAR